MGEGEPDEGVSSPGHSERRGRDTNSQPAETSAPSGSTYEDRFSRIGRWRRRAARRLRWAVKGLLGQPRIILVELRWRLGDEIMALPVIEALHHRYPKDRLNVWTHHPDLFAGNPAVAEVNGDTAPGRYIFLRDAPRDTFRPAHYARLAGIAPPASRPAIRYREWPLPETLGIEPPYLAICTGASWMTKRWPIEYWRTLCRSLEDSGHRIVQVGDGDEEIGCGVSLVGKTTVREAALVLRHARLLVCCDSGLMHLARAADAPVLALFGPTTPDILHPEDPGLHIMTNGRPCQGCWNVSMQMTAEGICPLSVPHCMDSIGPETVFQRIEAILQEGG